MKAIQQLEAAAARATGAERERILDRLADLYEADARRNEADNGQWLRNLPCGHQDHRLL